MASYILLYNCVALSVFFGSVLCGGGSTDSTVGTDPRTKILNVAMIKHFEDDKKFEGGVVECDWPNPNKNRRWLFVESRYWNLENGGSLIEAAPVCAFLTLDGIFETKRDGKEVFIMFEPRVKSADQKNGPNKEYTLIFANETDAKKFTAEDRRQ